MARVDTRRVFCFAFPMWRAAILPQTASFGNEGLPAIFQTGSSLANPSVASQRGSLSKATNCCWAGEMARCRR